MLGESGGFKSTEAELVGSDPRRSNVKSSVGTTSHGEITSKGRVGENFDFREIKC